MHHRTRTVVSTIALTLVLAAATAAGAEAATTFGLSHLTCVPSNGFTTRPGDDVECRLDVTAFEGMAGNVTADVTLPTGLGYDTTLSTNNAGTLDTSVSPPRIRYGTSVLGDFPPDFTKTVTMVLHIKDDGSISPGDPIAPVATVRSPTTADATIESNALFVTPPPAVLQPSTLTCSDLNGDPLRPGDVVECALQLVNQPKKEDATSVSVTVPIPGNTTWTPGGNDTSHTAGYISWAPAALPTGVPSGPASAPILRLRLTIGEAPGGTKVFPYASVNYVNSLSMALGSQAVFGPQLITAPGPAVLTSSALGCFDADSLPLYPGDTIRCTLTVADAAGREDVSDLTATIAVPGATTLSSDAAARTLTFGPPVFGTLASGTSRALPFTLRVDDAAAPGTVVAPLGTVRGTSVGTGARVAHDVTAPRLMVVARPVPAAPVRPGAAAAATPGSVAAGSNASPICASRRVVVVNVKPPKGRRWKAVTFSYATKAVKGKKASATGTFRARLVFQGLPKGPLKVSVKGVTTKGKVVRSTRTYNLCAKKR
jgi:hypothetical protein